jgi:hypothetical protein
MTESQLYTLQDRLREEQRFQELYTLLHSGRLPNLQSKEIIESLYHRYNFVYAPYFDNAAITGNEIIRELLTKFTHRFDPSQHSTISHEDFQWLLTSHEFDKDFSYIKEQYAKCSPAVKQRTQHKTKIYQEIEGFLLAHAFKAKEIAVKLDLRLDEAIGDKSVLDITPLGRQELYVRVDTFIALIRKQLKEQAAILTAHELEVLSHEMVAFEKLRNIIFAANFDSHYIKTEAAELKLINSVELEKAFKVAMQVKLGQASAHDLEKVIYDKEHLNLRKAQEKEVYPLEEELILSEFYKCLITRIEYLSNHTAQAHEYLESISKINKPYERIRKIALDQLIHSGKPVDYTRASDAELEVIKRNPYLKAVLTKDQQVVDSASNEKISSEEEKPIELAEELVLTPSEILEEKPAFTEIKVMVSEQSDHQVKKASSLWESFFDADDEELSSVPLPNKRESETEVILENMRQLHCQKMQKLALIKFLMNIRLG